jgi:hypothetical protein
MSTPTLSEARKLYNESHLFVVCGTCRKFQEGKAQGKDVCTGVACGGPISRRDYPEYTGDIKDFSAVCFACGSDDTLAYAQVAGSQKRFGLCKDHLEIIDNLISGSRGIEAQTKVMIYPRADRALDKFKDAEHAI